MTITLDLPNELGVEVAAQAETAGVAVEEYLPQLIRQALPATLPSALRQGSPEWLALLYQTPIVQRIDSATGQPPPITSREALRREHLYEDRS